MSLVAIGDKSEEGTTRLNRIARNRYQTVLQTVRLRWVSENLRYCYFIDVGKPFKLQEVLLLASVSNCSAIKHDATRWFGFWAESKLSVETNLRNLLAGAEGAWNRVTLLQSSSRLVSRILTSKHPPVLLTSTQFSQFVYYLLASYSLGVT